MSLKTPLVARVNPHRLARKSVFDANDCPVFEIDCMAATGGTAVADLIVQRLNVFDDMLKVIVELVEYPHVDGYDLKENLRPIMEQLAGQPMPGDDMDEDWHPVLRKAGILPPEEEE